MQPDEAEALEQRAFVTPPDPLSEALGSSVYIAGHRLAGCYLATALGRSPRLSASRFYWDLEPPVAVDFHGELRYGEDEIQAKVAYCDEHAIRYVVASDPYDEKILNALSAERFDSEDSGDRPIMARREISTR